MAYGTHARTSAVNPQSQWKRMRHVGNVNDDQSFRSSYRSLRDDVTAIHIGRL
jgi:hypothetical protein